LTDSTPAWGVSLLSLIAQLVNVACAQMDSVGPYGRTRPRASDLFNSLDL
jgi:hypothetical protein